ncbi:PKD domain-containing protein [Candidatus Bathyarchaeota archaeon]|nr:MAG: PKD domain-containing protein [Candidatus Bathyarchaeota archaeon]
MTTIYFSTFGNKMQPNCISNVYASNHWTNSRSLRLKSRLPVVIALALLAFSIRAPLLTSAGNIPEQRIPRTVHFVSPMTLGYAGIGPTTISLSWTESSDASFFEYVLQKYSTLLGWETIANLVSRTNTTFFSAGQDANANQTWQVRYQNTGGFQYSNNLTLTQPPAASLSYLQTTSTTAQLQWDNKAQYGGLLYFSSYQLMESINGETNFTRMSYTDVNSLSYTVGALSPSTSYSFYLNTTDQCIGNGCPASSFSSSLSNTVTISTPGPLAASAQASPATADVGEPANFVCTGAGGAPPYTYSWTFGDGNSGTGASLSHTYNDPGTMNAVCTVTDNFGTIVNSRPITYAVYIDPSISSFKATPASPDLGQRITFLVSASGGNRSLTYAYTSLPTGCSSIDSSSFSCIPTSSGTYDVTVTVTDQGQETANSTLRLSIAPPRVLGLPQGTGLAVIFGGILGTSAVAILSVILLLRRKGNVL